MKARILSDLPIGSRILYRAKEDWRSAAVCRIGEEKATLTVCSPTGRTYRLSRHLETRLEFEGEIPILISEHEDHWKENFTSYDRRW